MKLHGYAFATTFLAITTVGTVFTYQYEMLPPAVINVPAISLAGNLDTKIPADMIKQASIDYGAYLPWRSRQSLESDKTVSTEKSVGEHYNVTAIIINDSTRLARINGSYFTEGERLDQYVIELINYDSIKISNNNSTTTLRL
ncbi:MAG: hypothetical protein OEW97_07695 [Gammaproteobacteria bacterium]|nr:hypothetical protein [Gammaproteobacteria bacterium]MDH5692952.1 hypothetical protein [Gammaproteobacteria bacterium]